MKRLLILLFLFNSLYADPYEKALVDYAQGKPVSNIIPLVKEMRDKNHELRQEINRLRRIILVGGVVCVGSAAYCAYKQIR